MDFRKVLILLFIQTYDAINDISELIDLTGINYRIVRELISELSYDNYIYYDEKLKVYRMSQSGKEFLYSQYLNEISLEDLQILSRGPDPRRKSHVFIPRNFHKRFK